VVFLRELFVVAAGTHLEVYPRASGEVYLCGVGGSEYVSPDQLRAGLYPPGHVHPDPSRVAAAARAFAALSTRLTGPGPGGRPPDLAQACMRPCAPDALPMMGKVGHLKGAYLSAGHNCWGILWAPVSGKAMAELVLTGAASCADLAPFAPGRFTTVAAASAKGGRGRKRGTAAVGEQW
jgi:glycine/D-amino acid oxidase-like deaminating enzyme